MLGIETEHGPIQGEFAQRIKEQISRVKSGTPNGEDRNRIEIMDSQCEHEIVWG